MHLKNKTRKYILLGIIAFIFVGIIAANILANKQDATFETEEFIYQQAVQQYQSGNYAEAQKLIADLVVEKADSEQVNYLAGLIAASVGEYPSAAVYMQKALDINPHNVEAPMFMLQFGEVLFSAKRFDDAKIVLERCKEWNWMPEDYPQYQEQVQEMLTEIENMK